MVLSIIPYQPDLLSKCMSLIKSNQGHYFTSDEVTDYQQFLQSLKATDHYYVVLDENDVVAAGGIAEHNQLVRMTWGMVQGERHGQKIGSFLLQQRLNNITDLYPGLTIAMDTSQHTVGFYRRFGFRTLTREMNGYGEGLDKIELMRHSGEPIVEFESNVQLLGPNLMLRPMQQEDFEPLYQAASDPGIWAQHPASDRYLRPVFERFFNSGLTSGMCYIIENRQTGKVLGSSRFNNPDLDTGIVEIGWTFLIRSCWGGATNAELKHLMISHAFSYLNQIHFYIGKDNQRSIAAVKKLGAHRTSEYDDPDRSGSVVFELTPDTYVGLNKDIKAG